MVADKGLGQISDEGELVAIVERLIEENPAQAAQLRDGKDKLVGFFVGQAMKATGGRADPARVGELVRERVGPLVTRAPARLRGDAEPLPGGAYSRLWSLPGPDGDVVVKLGPPGAGRATRRPGAGAGRRHSGWRRR